VSVRRSRRGSPLSGRANSVGRTGRFAGSEARVPS
jgi:hypothetical protein